MAFPDWLSGVEQWMREKEDYADHLLKVIMTPATLSGMLFNLLLIAVLPAIGEELIFRGVFQKIFMIFSDQVICQYGLHLFYSVQFISSFMDFFQD